MKTRILIILVAMNSCTGLFSQTGENHFNIAAGSFFSCTISSSMSNQGILTPFSNGAFIDASMLHTSNSYPPAVPLNFSISLSKGLNKGFKWYYGLSAALANWSFINATGSDSTGANYYNQLSANSLNAGVFIGLRKTFLSGNFKPYLSAGANLSVIDVNAQAFGNLYTSDHSIYLYRDHQNYVGVGCHGNGGLQYSFNSGDEIFIQAGVEAFYGTGVTVLQTPLQIGFSKQL